MLLFSSLEKVNVKLKVPGKKLEHHGIKIEFVGQIGRQSLCVCVILLLWCNIVWFFLMEAAYNCTFRMALCHSGSIWWKSWKLLGLYTGMHFINLQSIGMTFGPEQNWSIYLYFVLLIVKK